MTRFSQVCYFCDKRVDETDEENYRQVSSWVNGPKLDGPKLRQQTGLLAHKSCVKNVVAGQAPDQPTLLDEPGIYKEVSLGKLEHIDPPSVPPLYG